MKFDSFNSNKCLNDLNQYFNKTKYIIKGESNFEQCLENWTNATKSFQKMQFYLLHNLTQKFNEINVYIC